MRKILLFTLCALPIIAFAQELKQITPFVKTNAKQVEYNSRTNFPTLIKFDSRTAPSAIQDVHQIDWAKDIFPLTTNDQLAFVATHNDKQTGYTFHKFQQKFNNIPVEYAIVRVKEYAGKISSINGDYNSMMNIENSIAIDAVQALVFAKQAVPAKVYKWERKKEEQQLKKDLGKPDFSFDPKTSLVVLPLDKENGRTFYYAYKLDIFCHEPLGRYNVYIDAETGALLKKVSTTCAIDVKTTANTRYHGQQEMMADSLSPNLYRLKETNRKGRGMQIETLNCETFYENDAVDFESTTKTWSMANAQKDDAALDCHFAAGKTYDYYYDSLNYNSYDGAGSKLLQYVHYDLNYFNAFWTGSYSCYGDGTLDPLTSIDVVSHEITHGVTQFTAGLEYELESGALNESFSDIFGTVVEYNSLQTGFSWRIGTRSFTLRNMADPLEYNNPDTYGGAAWTNTVDCFPNGNNDYCGVHNNSGVQNFWFYVLAQGDTGVNDLKNPYSVIGIGIDKAAKIAFKNLRDYLTPNSNFADARRGSIEAAIELYGFNSQEVQSVMNAWYAVGVGKPYTFLPDAEFKVERILCAPNSTISFVNLTGNGQSYHWDFGDGATSTNENPSHKYVNLGSYDVRLIATNLNGSDTLLMKNMVNIFTDSPIPSTCSVNMLTPIGTTGIYRVEFAGIDNPSSGPMKEDPYMDFNCYRANVERNGTYPIKITTHNTSPVFTRVYIDWNNNGSFDLPSEMVMKTDTTLQYHYDTLHVPTDAVLNLPLRMRVISAKATNNKPNEPCSGLRNGQIEDYSVLVSPASGINKMSYNTINVYPNPTDDEINIQSSNELIMLQLIDMLGKTVIQTQFVGSANIDVSQLPAGVYTVKLMHNNSADFQKVIIK